MKNRKKEIAFLTKILLIPIINIFMVIIIANSFTVNLKEKNIETMSILQETKNEKYITVLFHKTEEIKKVDIDEHLMGVLPAEMPPSFEEEALKAQAVAARTFIINRDKNKDQSAHNGASVCTDSTHCKAYMTEEECKKAWGEDWERIYKPKIKKAVYETQGICITYNNEPISAVFHSTSSGMTENSEDVWQTALPYLRSVKSEGEDKSPKFSSKVVKTTDEFKTIILNKYPDIILGSNPSYWIGEVEHTTGGSVKTVKIGNKTIKGTEIRSLFGLRSANFVIKIGNNVEFQVKGNGHGVGMSQYGANYAAEQGKKYEEILKKYYQGIELKKLY